MTALFSPWLVAWARFALTDELASYVLLIPLVSAGLIWKAWRPAAGLTKPAMRPSVIATIAAAVLVTLAWFAQAGTAGVGHDFLTPAILGYILGLVACAFFTRGLAFVQHHAFAFGFLMFAAPLPSWAVHGLEVFFQHTSAEVATWLIPAAGIPMLRSGLVFQLPGITLQVAQECSGIRSSLILLIVSVYAGHLMWRSPFRRWLLALVVIPLGIARNGFRIVTLAALCTHVSPTMIDSPIHHRGGPIFFALSLIPLVLLMAWLRRRERQ